MVGWNGSGVFERQHNWTDDANNGIKIRADRHDEEDDNLAIGLNNCLTKDGQNAATGNINLGSNRIYGLADGTGANDAVTLGQMQENSGIYIATTGSSNAYVATLSPAYTGYVAGQGLLIKANHTNTGAATLNVNGRGATALKKNGDVDVASGDIQSGHVYHVIYDGTNFQVVNVYLTDNVDIAGTLDVTGAFTADGNATITGTLTQTGAADFGGDITGGQFVYNAQTGTTYTLQASDEGKIVTLNNSSAITLTLPQQSTTTLPQGFNCIIRQLGAGTVTVAVEGSDTVNSKSSLTSLAAQYSEAQIDLQTAGSPNTWHLAGDLA